MQPFLSLLKNYTNPLGHKHAHACLHLVICSPECKSECCQIPIFLPGNLSSYPMLHLWASQHYWYLLTVLFIPRNSIHHWPGLGHPMEMCGWLHRCLLPVVCFLCNDNHKSNELMFILQITDPIRWQALKNIWVKTVLHHLHTPCWYTTWNTGEHVNILTESGWSKQLFGSSCTITKYPGSNGIRILLQNWGVKYCKRQIPD